MDEESEFIEWIICTTLLLGLGKVKQAAEEIEMVEVKAMVELVNSAEVMMVVALGKVHK